jgi:hypothetical protein
MHASETISRSVSPPDSKILFPNTEQTTSSPQALLCQKMKNRKLESKKNSVIVASIHMMQARFSQIFRAFGGLQAGQPLRQFSSFSTCQAFAQPGSLLSVWQS